eukprot:CAMPEP_0170573228 /NCGR_PEP_ID=MMETSP0224-20130122/2653_1 /TAXON_ID=285029 /ORGANISM="Togula jolla, Strain CCCM 725" /LENGTH=147 /DNA_ID=CAMNT_0010895801 /DNA_START=272 /DNA_END=715 /DNA_ORIENTATION=+
MAGTLVEPSALDMQALAVQLVVALVCTIPPYAYWWFVIVPNRRRELAKGKRKGGEVREYLEDLAAAPAAERKPERWLYDRYLREAGLKAPRPAGSAGLPEAVEALEDGLQDALPGGGFWSFDNPVFVYFVLLAAYIIFQVVSHAVTG